jgi:hypothetical protein
MITFHIEYQNYMKFLIKIKNEYKKFGINNNIFINFTFSLSGI